MKVLLYSAHPELRLTDDHPILARARGMVDSLKALGHEAQLLLMGDEVTPAAPAKGGARLFGRLQQAMGSERKRQTDMDYDRVEFDNEVAFPRLLDRIETYQPDVLIEFAQYIQVSGVVAAGKKNLFHVLDMAGPLPELRIQEHGESNLLDEGLKREYQQLSSTNLIVVPSQTLKDYFLERYELLPGNFVVVPGGIHATAASETEWGQIGWLGMDMEWPVLREVLGHIPSDQRLLIPSTSKLDKAIARDFPQVRFERLSPAAIRERMSLLLSTDMRGFRPPAEVFLAASAAIPVVALAQAALTEVAVNGTHLRMAPAEQLGAALAESLATPEESRDMGKRLQSHLQQHFSWKGQMDHILEAYEASRFRFSR